MEQKQLGAFAREAAKTLKQKKALITSARC